MQLERHESERLMDSVSRPCLCLVLVDSRSLPARSTRLSLDDMSSSFLSAADTTRFSMCSVNIVCDRLLRLFCTVAATLRCSLPTRISSSSSSRLRTAGRVRNGRKK